MSYFSSRGASASGGNMGKLAETSSAASEWAKNHLRHSQYEKTINVIDSVIDPAKVHYCFFETMRRKSEIEKVCEFLSVDPTSITLPGKVNASKPSNASIPDQILNNIRRELAATYKFCSEKFKDIPDEWQDSMNKLQSRPAAAMQ